MSSLTLKDIPPDLLERLRVKAKEERRSMSAEAITILQRALARDHRTPQEREEAARRLEAMIERLGPSEIDFETIRAARTFGRDIAL